MLSYANYPCFTLALLSALAPVWARTQIFILCLCAQCGLLDPCFPLICSCSPKTATCLEVMARDGVSASSFHQLLGEVSKALVEFKHAVARLFKYECPIETNHQRQQ